MSKILIRGYQQRRHIKRLLTEFGHEVDEFHSRKPLQILRVLDYIKQIKNSDILYFVGGNITKSKFYVKIARRYKKDVVIHWVGSDVLHLPERIDLFRPYFEGVKHLTCSEMLQKELEECEVFADHIPLVPYDMDLNIQPIPEKHAVMVYLPEGKEEFYGSHHVRILALEYPDITFHIVANEGFDELRLPNVCFYKKMNFDELNELYKKVSVLVRLTEHDGLPMMMLESLAKGKSVVYRFTHPYVSTPKSLEREDVIAAFDEIVSKPPVLNEEGSRYVREFYSPDSVMELYRKYNIV